MIIMAAAKTPMTTAQVADEFGTTPRELRKFLRSNYGPGKVGKGARYSLPGTKRELITLRKGFDAWSAAGEKTKSDKATEAVDEVDSDNEDIEPSDEELDEIDDEV